MIHGIGVDLADVRRVERGAARGGEEFLRAFLTEAEIRECAERRRPGPCHAARFAAKEAFVKALGTGLTGGMSWLDLELGRDGCGRPVLRLSGAAAEEARARGVTGIHVSLTHEKNHAAAVVVLESRTGRIETDRAPDGDEDSGGKE